MSASPLTNLSRLAIHTQTNKPWSLGECVGAYSKAGVRGISVWRDVLGAVGVKEGARMLRDAGMRVSALVRGGFFPGVDEASRQKAVEENLRCIDEAAGIGAEMVVLVVGAVPGIPLSEARKQVTEGISKLLDHAKATNVKLAIEPLHPMYAADRSCINRMAEARNVCEELQNPLVGIAVDVYHVWWDPDLEAEIALCGRQKTLFAFHVCDWRVQTRNLITDRGLMGDGCIPIRTIRSWVEAAGFDGFIEVEVFSEDYWSMNQDDYLERIKSEYLSHA